MTGFDELLPETTGLEQFRTNKLPKLCPCIFEYGSFITLSTGLFVTCAPIFRAEMGPGRKICSRLLTRTQAVAFAT